MFEHELFEVHDFENVPVGFDCFMMDEIYLEEYEKSMIELFNGGDWRSIGYVCSVSVNKVENDYLEFTFLMDYFKRFHSVCLTLPRDKFITCVESRDVDEKPHIFVDTNWLDNLLTRFYSIFVMVDAIDVKKALRNGKISLDKLISLRQKIDNIAEKYLDVSFITFADSVILKSYWSCGDSKNKVPNTYKPEIFFEIFKLLQNVYEEILGLKIYGVFTQGHNEYCEDSLLHISETKNHICLNSLGIPFSQLLSIDQSARNAIRNKKHPESELYLDESFLFSLDFKSDFDKNTIEKSDYRDKLIESECFYYYCQLEYLEDKLKYCES